MSMQELAELADIISAIAVIITLIYLAIQIRQNTKQIEENTNADRAAAIHANVGYGLETRISIYSNSEMASIYARGLENPEALDEIEVLRFRLAMASVVDTFHNMFTQTKLTGFSPETWEAQAHTARRVLGTNGGRWFWNIYRHEYSESFRNEIDSLLNPST